MKILLVGEYNRVHWNLKEGLRSHGHEAMTFAMRDGFKKVDVDIEIKNPFSGFIMSKLRTLIFKLSHVDLLGVYVNLLIRSKKKSLSNHDIVQFISESPFTIEISSQKKAFKTLSDWNKNTFILSSGKDYPSIIYAYNKQLKYSILTPYFENKGFQNNYKFALRYIEPEYKVYHDFVYSKIKGVIACDFDYHLPLKNHPKYLGLIPHAIDIEKIEFAPQKPTSEVIIFHGVNKANFFMKGNHLFEEALSIIKEKHGNKVKIISVSNLPYSDYIKALKSSHILLDQVFSYDLGYNALEAMAMGKVVFSGAEREWRDHYDIREDTVVINALPDVSYLVQKMDWLIENPEMITKIALAARNHVETNHNYKVCAEMFIRTWTAIVT